MVKKKKEDKILRDLFKEGFEGMGIDPSPSFGPALMKSVRRGEFFSFIPSKFNVWYAGLIAITVAVTTLVITIDAKEEVSPVNESPAEMVTVQGTDPLYADTTDALPVAPSEDTVQAGESILDLVETAITSVDNLHPAAPSELLAGEEVIDDIPAKKVDTTPVIETETIQVELVTANDMPSVRSAVEPLFAVSAYKGCSPLRVCFTVADDEGDSYRWSFGDGGYSSDREPEWLFDEEGEYEVTLKVFKEDEVIASFSSTITVYPKPVARFEIMPAEATIPDDEVTFLNYSTGALAYSWSFGDGTGSELFEPAHVYERYGSYDVTLVALSEFGCADSLTLSNAFSTSSYYIEFPNAFIPNPSGESGGYYTDTPSEADKVFHPVYNGVSSYQLRIYNRQGVMLFESNDIYIGWDGYYRSHICDPGVYIWKVRGSFLNGEPFTRMGDVTLINMTE